MTAARSISSKEVLRMMVRNRMVQTKSNFNVPFTKDCTAA